MRNSWYYRRAGVDSGPVVFERLIALAQSGNLGPADQVRRSDEQSWSNAGDVEGLFPEPAAGPDDGESLFDDILDVAASDDGSHASGQRVGTRLEDQQGYDPYRPAAVKVARYYCRVQGKESGPYTISELQQRADDGLISAFDRVRSEDGKAWVPAQEISEIKFNAKPARTPNPGSRSSTAEPPVKDRSRSATESHVQSIDSVIDDVLSGESEAPSAAFVPVSPAKSVLIPAPSAPPIETRTAELPSRHASMLAAAMTEATAANSTKTPKKEKRERRVSKSGSSFQFQMPGTGLMTVLTAVVVLALLLTWIQREGTPPIHGEAKVDGQPIPVGSISFFPVADTKDAPLTTPIIEGKFAGGPDDSLVDGKYNVRVIVGNPLGIPSQELTSVPTFAALNGAVFEKEIDTTSGGENLFVFEFVAADAKMPAASTGNIFSLE